MTNENQFNPELFQYDSTKEYKWLVFPRTTLAIVTWNRLAHTKKLLDSLLRLTHIPHEYLIVDNGSTDGTVAFLEAFASEHKSIQLILNSQNLGLARAHYQIQQAATDGLIIIFDNDLEILSNYWLLHIQKAFHAIRVNEGNTNVALGVRLINCDEYGFRYTGQHEVLNIPSSENSPPRSSFSTVTKESADADQLLNEAVVIGWTDHLIGGAIVSVPVSLLKQLPMKDQYPDYIGGTDSYFSNSVLDAGGRLGYVENGPVARHNDWPYTEEKISAYESMVGQRASLDFHYVRWKIRNFMRKFGI